MLGVDYMRETGSFLVNCPQNEPGLKIFLLLYDEKIYAAHKRT